tara:strand:+ start:508 stop:894 length:387 start_codon:yes stop_codon:yes gene_type:complete
LKKIVITEVFQNEPEELWEILSDLSRSDWVPGVDEIRLEGDVREFDMEGMGKVKEQIIECNDENLTLKYSAIETVATLNHHLACMQIEALDKGSLFKWTTEIDPEIFADSIEVSMKVSLESLKSILSS